MLPRSSRATLRVVVLTIVRLVVLFVGALAGGSVVILDEHADVTSVRSYTDVADVDQTFLGGLGRSVARYGLAASNHRVAPRRRVFPETGLPEMLILGNPRV